MWPMGLLFIVELIYNEVMSYENQGQNPGKQPAQPMQNHSGEFVIKSSIYCN